MILKKRKSKRRKAAQSAGYAYEQHCVRKMMWHGWHSIEHVGSGGGDYGADIVARSFFFQKIVVQCKHYSGKVGVKAVQEVAAARQYYGASRAAVATNSTFTRQAEKLARACGVELWKKY